MLRGMQCYCSYNSFNIIGEMSSVSQHIFFLSLAIIPSISVGVVGVRKIDSFGLSLR